MTALMWAAWNGHAKIVDALLAVAAIAEGDAAAAITMLARSRGCDMGRWFWRSCNLRQPGEL